ncbi:Asp-tRNA(Asn)/Glu-tRNA(Gln) amidotransferase subunit GatC [Helicobacter jaachi]|uniref:Aspartyl/glutamyl-tRNA(Asn/Gln) amidotransferase subunit C n=1 Tax=Helicobacter jaachi TaxID=1677920 RepID=A0A4U8TBD1_9HELI|nr:Asp-tRNA(Asn)/Glu-tRNA(Gln) amidotransferase subunit GatC [Helicobacter jaachi]TLD97230.1 Asp-tRNA(Asn)/Glu-tRNA(Gln) amidotransferase subunit GatC [Helicobacter jaachi]
MRIDDTLLNKLERLSMLHIDETKRVATQEQLSEILGFVENIASITDRLDKKDTSDYALGTPLRADVVVGSCVGKDVLAHAPQAEDNFFIVPKIIE